MGKVIVRYIENMQHQVIAPPHSFIADEPIEAQGDGLGPNPYDLLLSALGTCTAMTIILYARKKAIPLEWVEVQLEHSKTYIEDCKDCSEEERRMEKIKRSIRVKGNLDDAQKEALLKVSSRCPVHRTISSKPIIEDEIFLL